MKWQVLSENKDVIKALLKNRGIEDEKEFFNPKDPREIKLGSVNKIKERIVKARDEKEQVIVYGDYDADGICATAIAWEALHNFGLDVLPHIPDRFEEGYGVNAQSVEILKSQIPNIKLIITVDNGIVAYDGIKKAKELGIDVVVLDHHQKGSKKIATPYVFHDTSVCGSALAWFFAKELGITTGLELAAIGTIADQMPLKEVNRSIVKYGLIELNKTKRPGLLALFKDSKIDLPAGRQEIGTYEVNYIIAPRINAMGRLAHGIDSLRLLCTKKLEKALELSKLLSKTNFDRQKIVEELVVHTKNNITDQKIIVIANEGYHEGVIGLAAGKLVEEFYRPAIVLSIKGKMAKASARSIPGFNIIEAIRNVDLHTEGGGHPMAAGFSIDASKIKKFEKEINKYADKLLTDELLERKLRVDLKIDFEEINPELVERVEKFNPTGVGNPTPTFLSNGVEVMSTKTVGNGSKHLKLKLRENEQVFDAIFFGGGEKYSKLKSGSKVDAAYNIEENVWNGVTSIQLRIKDLHLPD